MDLFQELTEIILNINEADIPAEQKKEARQALLEDAGLQLEILTDLQSTSHDVEIS